MSRRGWIVVGITAGSVTAGVLGGVLLSRSRADMAGEWGKALITLFVAILISGLLTLILSDYSQSQQRQAANRNQAFNWLSLLLGANNRFQSSLILIDAHKSARTYSDQVRHMIEVRETLRSLKEDLETLEEEVAADLQKILDYLEDLGDEYRHNYPRMSWAQRLHEERIKRYLAQDELPSEPMENADAPWLLLQGGDFPKLADLLSSGDGYQERYRTPYNEAKGLLRERLKKFGHG